MKSQFTRPEVSVHTPDGVSHAIAFKRTTHLGVGAHQDDLEFMAMHGILECFQKQDRWFSGIICTDGAGSSRTGDYCDYSDEDMKSVREGEQKTAAAIGQYSFVAQLAHPSQVAKEPDLRFNLVRDLQHLFEETRPDIVYTHNPFDKHPTHVGVFLAVLEAIRGMPLEERPPHLVGCEVWRGLDWLPDTLKVVQNVSAHPNLAASLNGVFDSQIVGGKRYDLAVEGRRLANATFFDAHSIDGANKVQYAVNLDSLIDARERVLGEFVAEYLSAFKSEIEGTLRQLKGRV